MSKRHVVIGLGATLGALLMQSQAFCLETSVVEVDKGTSHVWHVSPQPLADVPENTQFRSIAEAAKTAQAGDTVLIHSGVYRETVLVSNSGTAQRPIRFLAAPAANVILTGADRITNWRKEDGGEGDNIYSTDWNWDVNPPRDNKPINPSNIVMRSEQVFVQDYPLAQVVSRAALSRGTFWVDGDNKRLYVWASDNAKLPEQRVEVSTRPLIWQTTGEYVQVRGLRFRYAANQAQKAAAQFHGRGGVTEDCIFERTNSVGASFRAPEQTIRRCVFQDNGQMGFGAFAAHNSLMTGCTVRNNNTKNYGRGWEAGGDKIVLTRNMVIENSQFVNNRGTGIWFDIGNENDTVRNCLLANNEDTGIFYEISYGLQLHDNVIVGNGLAEYPGWWGGWSGVTLSSSPNCVIERNLIVANKEGFNFREQSRTTPRLDAPKGTPEVAVWNHDQVIRNNVLAYNRDAQVWGWFDTKEEAHWPVVMQSAGAKPVADNATAPPQADLAADYQAKGETGKPKNLSLEKLHLDLNNNLYALSPGQGLLQWGARQRRHKEYTALSSVQQELGIEKGSVVSPFEFADYPTLDFRVPANSLALKMGAYPRGEVPGVKLGILPK